MSSKFKILKPFLKNNLHLRFNFSIWSVRNVNQRFTFNRVLVKATQIIHPEKHDYFVAFSTHAGAKGFLF